MPNSDLAYHPLIEQRYPLHVEATTSKGNAHAWMGGFVPYDPGKKSNGLAAAVWVGNKAEEQAIKDAKK